MTKKLICPITNKVFDCQKCKEPDKNDRCPYHEWDETIEHTIQFIRKLVERQK